MTLKPLSAAARAALARAFPDESNRTSSGFMRVTAQADNTAELLIYGDIGRSWWDDTSVSAADVVKSLQGIDATTINVRISSNGGSVADGFAIHNELRRQAKNGVAINVTVDSVAYSIASLIAMAGDNVAMYANSLMMLHAPSIGLYFEGNRKQMAEVYDEITGWLASYEQGMSTSYARKTGKPAADFAAMWEAGTDFKYSADEAKAFGLCDEILDDPNADATPDDAEQANAAFLQQLVANTPNEMRAALHAAFRASAPNPPAPAGTRQAAPSAATQPMEAPMPEKKPADNPNPAPHDAQAIAANAAKALRERNTEIRALAAPYADNKDITDYVNGVIDDADIGVTAGDVGKKILALVAKDRAPLNGGGHVVAGTEERSQHAKAMEAAIDARLGRGDRKAMDGNPYAYMSMSEMARACATAAGIDTRGMDAERYIRAAITHTTSDFPILLGGAFRRSLLRGYESVPEVFDQFTRAVPVPDFRTQSLAGLGQFIGVKDVGEGGEYPYGTISENGQRLKLTKKGAIFSITWEAIQNDDLGVIDSIPMKMGQGAKRALGDDVFSLITTNPLQGDGVALFHANHRNLYTAAALSTASLDAAFRAQALQKDPDGNPIRIPTKYVLVPVGMGGLARQILTSQYAVNVVAGKNSTEPNIMKDRFVVVEDPRLDAADTKAWYVVGDPNAADGIVIAYLNGEQVPTISQKEGWNVEGIEIKVRLAAKAGIADWRSLGKNPGV